MKALWLELMQIAAMILTVITLVVYIVDRETYTQLEPFIVGLVILFIIVGFVPYLIVTLIDWLVGGRNVDRSIYRR